MIREMFENGYVMKCIVININFLVGFIGVDVLIKINCINFIEKNLLNESKFFSILECCNLFFFVVKKFIMR